MGTRSRRSPKTQDWKVRRRERELGPMGSREDDDYWNDKEWLVWGKDEGYENIQLDEELDDETPEGEDG